MEDGEERGHWKFKPNNTPALADMTVRSALNILMSNLDAGDQRPVIPLGHGDPSRFPCFRTTAVAEDAVIEALRSGQHNCYSSTTRLAPSRRAVAEYLNRDLPYELTSDDVHLTVGAGQGIDIVLSALARPGSNILLPRPGFPYYEALCAMRGIEPRHFDLVPENGWEVDLDAVEALADENTAAIVIINPGNPCGNVFTYEHLSKIADTARRLGILVISDEVYQHLVFGSNPFTPMGVFGSIAPVLTLGSISKRWLVPGWRLGWIIVNDPKHILTETKIIDSIIGFLDISSDPVTFIQAALPQILLATKEDFFNRTIAILKQTANICFDMIEEIQCITCPQKPDGSMFVMVNLNLSHIEGISDDVDFCCKLAKEESVVILPGSVVGLKNWLRVTFAVDPSSLKEGLSRLQSFCKRHETKK